MGAIKEEAIGFLFNLEVQVEQPQPIRNLTYSAPSEEGDSEVKAQGKNPPESTPGSSFFKK
jgi:hypothetical protein